MALIILSFIVFLCFRNGLAQSYAGDACNKNGNPGTCMNIRDCRSAQADPRNNKICGFANDGYPIVCCLGQTSFQATPASVGSTTTEYVPDSVEYRDNSPHAGGCAPIPSAQTAAKTGRKAWDSYCELKRHPSVTYYCGNQECGDHILAGNRVRSECNHPNYHRSGDLDLDVHMSCTESGQFNRDPLICQPVCGTISPEGQELLFNGTKAEPGRFPWHAAIYKKETPYRQICGGSLISTRIVLSAAHCFYKNSILMPSSNYAVGLGKIYRPWNDHRDKAQKFDVADIKIPDHYRDAAANFQNDLAMVFLSTLVEITPFIRPVCLDFNNVFDKEQLKVGNKGSVPGWGLTETGYAPEVLNYAELPYVTPEMCFDDLPRIFQAFITRDKICAGTLNGTSLCQGDSGGGLVFPHVDKVKTLYYLRGIVSTAPTDDSFCNPNVYTTFTHVIKHDNFIKKYITGYEAQGDNQPK